MKYMDIHKHKLYKRLYECSKYSNLLLKILDFIVKDKSLQSFLSFIDKKEFVSSEEIAKFFNNKYIYFDNKYFVKEWEDFLSQYSFKKNYNMLFHDIVGHIILKNDVTSKGEILATAGMCGFSFELGKFYFVNAILIFSLGYKLFDDTRSDYSDISKYIEDINIAYKNGLKLRKFLNFDENLLEDFSLEEYLMFNYKKLKRCQFG